MTYHRLTVHINTLQCNEAVTVLQCNCRESAACVVQARLLVSQKIPKQLCQCIKQHCNCA